MKDITPILLVAVVIIQLFISAYAINRWEQADREASACQSYLEANQWRLGP